jgi:hypothetical protein
MPPLAIAALSWLPPPSEQQLANSLQHKAALAMVESLQTLTFLLYVSKLIAVANQDNACFQMYFTPLGF